MKTWHIVAAAAIIVGAVVGVAGWTRHTDLLATIKHETDRWAVIEDVNGDRMAVEPADDKVWLDLVSLNQNGTRMFVGGIVEAYGNKWGFRFKPDTVTIAHVTAEGLQGTIGYISAHVEDWLGGWAYVSSRVVEAHS